MEFQSGALGLAVVSDEAVAVGVTAVPTPVTEIASDLWYAHQVYFADAVSLTDLTVGGGRYRIDSKAMRKVEDGQDIAIVAENAAAFGQIISFAGRFLIKTH